MSIPKIIWALWCNFDTKTNGKLTPSVEYFKNRIIEQHLESEWKINIITSWDKLISYISKNPVLLEILNNKFIIPAHKTDAIRFFLLQEYGGFWLDISTFLFTSLDIYYEKQPNATFIGYYTPPFMVEEIMFSSLGDMFDSVKYDQVVKKFKTIQTDYIKLNEKYINYPFIPENFFIASIPKHPIISEILKNMLKFWEDSMPLITDKETLCHQINLLMNDLAEQVFTIKHLNNDLIKSYTNDDITNNNFLKNILNDQWHCGYIFNYIQMYIAVVNYIEQNNLQITQEENAKELKTDYNQDLCSIDNNINACKNIVATNIKDKTVIYLLSLSHNRLIKWANTMDERISFDNTYISNLLNDIGKTPGTTKESVIQHIIGMGIYQIKFSSWTRGSRIIEKIMETYPLNSSIKLSKSDLRNIAIKSSEPPIHKNIKSYGGLKSRKLRKLRKLRKPRKSMKMRILL
jgi:hypothetical protein